MTRNATIKGHIPTDGSSQKEKQDTDNRNIIQVHRPTLSYSSRRL